MKILPLLLCLPPLASAQFYNVSTVAGIGLLPFSGGGGAALSARLIQPYGVVADSAGNFFVSDQYYHQVFRVSAAGIIAVYAGTGVPGFTGDGGPATAAQIFPEGLALDSTGTLYIACGGNGRVRKVSPDGTITTVAGNGRAGVAGDGGNALSAALGGPVGVAVDAAGNLYVSQVNDNVVRVVRPNGTITTFAGTGNPGYSGDGGPATAAQLLNPRGVSVDAAGNVYVADSENNRIRKITPQGVITTAAGNGQTGFSGDGGQATAARLLLPWDVTTDANGNLYIADTGTSRIRMVSPGGIISTFAGGGASGDDGPAAQAFLPAPSGVAVDSNGNILMALLYGHQVRRVTQQRAITTIAGVPPTIGLGDNIPATSAPFLDPWGVAIDGAGNIFISDNLDSRIRKISPAGIITTIAGSGVYSNSGDGGPAVSAAIGNPRGMTFDQAGNLYIELSLGSRVRRIAPNGTITTIAGSGGVGFSGNGASAVAATLLAPAGIAVDRAGNIYIADTENNRIRKVDTAGIITTIAGAGQPGYSGDNGPATAAKLFVPRQLALDNLGNLYVADTGNHRIRKIAGGTITTVAGNGAAGGAGDGGPATAAQLSGPFGVAVDTAGNLYIANSGTSQIRKVDASTGVIATIAGKGGSGFSGDGGLATAALINEPTMLALDGSGNIYFTDRLNQRVRKLTPAQIVPEGVANGATLKAGSVAPGEIVTIYGSNLGPSTAAGLQLDASGRVATQLAGTQVMFDGVPAPLLFAASSQINLVVPYEVAGAASTQVQVIVQGKPTNTVTLPVVASSPGVFAITNQDGSVNSPSNPAAAGSVLVLYGTGEGQTNPAGVDGNVSTSVFPKPVLPLSIQIGGQNAPILYQGAAPGFVSGVLQVNVQIPPGVSGVVPLQLQIGNASTPPGLTITVRGQ